jgi:hypothetical protein
MVIIFSVSSAPLRAKVIIFSASSAPLRAKNLIPSNISPKYLVLTGDVALEKKDNQNFAHFTLRGV